MAADQSQSGAVAVGGPGRPASMRSLLRWFVHLGLLATAAGAVLALIYLDHLTVHVAIGLGFVFLVIIHLIQRRKTVSRMISNLGSAQSVVSRSIRLAASDAVLAFLTLNVLVSGLIDWIRGQPIPFPLAPPFNTWHKFSGIVLVGYLIVHVARRWKRIRRSTIR
jgi:hypothetical protein